MNNVRSIHFVLVAVAIVFAYTPAAQGGSQAASTTTIVNLELRNTPIKGAIDSLFVGTGLDYTIDPCVTGNVVELKLKGVSFKDALDAFCNAAGLAYTVVDGIYAITSAPSKTEACQTKTVVKSTPSQPPPAPAAAPAEESATMEPPQQQKAQAANQTGPQSGEVYVTQTANPVIVAPPSYPGYPGYEGAGGGYGGGWTAPVGFIGSGGGWGGPILVGPGPPLVWTRDYLPPPPPGYVNPEVQRFLQTQYAIKGRQYVTPIY